jgi:hypothetical protein
MTRKRRIEAVDTNTMVPSEFSNDSTTASTPSINVVVGFPLKFNLTNELSDWSTWYQILESQREDIVRRCPVLRRRLESVMGLFEEVLINCGAGGLDVCEDVNLHEMAIRAGAVRRMWGNLKRDEYPENETMWDDLQSALDNLLVALVKRQKRDSSHQLLPIRRRSFPMSDDFQTSNRVDKIEYLSEMVASEFAPRHEQSSNFIHIPGWLLYIAGLQMNPQVDRKLFVRKSCIDQFKFLFNMVIDQQLTGFIHGQPGTGKSITTLVAACCLLTDYDWHVLWIHVNEHQIRCCISRLIVADDSWPCFDYGPVCADDVAELLERFGNRHGKLLLVVDGISATLPLYGVGIDWANRDRTNRRLIRVSSMGSSQADPKQCSQSGILSFFQSSWTFEEYMAAVENESFAASVIKAFSDIDIITNDCEPTSSNDPKTFVARRLHSKYYLAGGCARFMFEYTRDMIQAELDYACDSVRNYSDLAVSSAGSYSDQIRNRLYQVFQVRRKDGRLTLARSFVCAYIEELIASRYGPNEIKKLAQDFWVRDSPSSVGSLFERYFFSCLWKDPCEIELINSLGEKVIWNDYSDYLVKFNPYAPTIADCAIGEWRRPIQSNFGSSIDGIKLVELVDGCRSGILHMVQITTATTHGFNFKYVKLIIDKLKQGVFTVTDIKITFIVPECIRRKFKISLTKEDRSGLFTFGVQETLDKLGWTGDVDTLIDRFEIFGLPAWDQHSWPE